MGSCLSCPQKESIPDDHHCKFKVINVDDDGNELGSGVMELTEAELVLHTRRRDDVRWPYLCLRRYGYDSNLFSFESGRRCQTGQGIFAFKCPRAEEIFNMLQEVMHSHSISVVEEAVMETHTHTTALGYSVPSVPNGLPRPSMGEAGGAGGAAGMGEAVSHPSHPSHPSTRHPSIASTRLPSVGEESTHPLLVAEDHPNPNPTHVHTYVNTSGLLKEPSSPVSVCGAAPAPLESPSPISSSFSSSSSLTPPSPPPPPPPVRLRPDAKAPSPPTPSTTTDPPTPTLPPTPTQTPSAHTEEPTLLAHEQVTLEGGGVARFVLGPTPVQRQLMEKKQQKKEGDGAAVEAGGAREAGGGAGGAEAEAGGPRGGCTDSENGPSEARSEAGSGSEAVDGSSHNKEAPPPPPQQQPVPVSVNGAGGAGVGGGNSNNNSVTAATTITTVTTTTGSSSSSRRARPPPPPLTPDPHNMSTSSQNVNNSAQRRTALLDYENLPALPPVWEARKLPPPNKNNMDPGAEKHNNNKPHPHPNPNPHPHPHPNPHPHPHPNPNKNSFLLNGYTLGHHAAPLSAAIESSHNYVNTENVSAPLSARYHSHGSRREASIFNFDFRRPAETTPKTLNYIEVEMDTTSSSSHNKAAQSGAASDGSNPHTPRTPSSSPLLLLPPPSSPAPLRRTELYALIDIERTAAMSSLQRARPRDDGTARKTRHNSTELPTKSTA